MRCHSRHKRHVRLLAELYAAGWKVSAAWPSHGATGFSVGFDVFHRLQRFYPFNSTYTNGYFAPPCPQAGQVVFALERRRCGDQLESGVVIRGWSNLRAFLDSQREIQKLEGGAR